MSDGSGCFHETMKKSFIVPTSMECAKCGIPELYVLRYNIGALEQDKLELIKLTHDLQDVIGILKHGLKGDYDLDMWLDWAIEKKAMQERIAALEKELKRKDEVLAWDADKILECTTKIVEQSKRIALLERSAALRDKIIEELESRLTPKQCGECYLKPNEICDICGAMGGVDE